MIKNDTLIALSDGYHVILKGILSVKSYDGVLEEIIVVHPNNNFMYYFDISLEETIRRHATRTVTLGSGFGEKDMREWYPTSYRSDHPLEQVILESSPINDTVSKILLDTGL